ILYHNLGAYFSGKIYWKKLSHNQKKIEAEGEVHFPELISFNDELLQGIELFSDGSQERNQRVNAYKNILTGESYKKITDRMKSWFGEG
ncbi:MAG: hypothetical protein K2M91_09385, partial [Lachnospiraceae bacterium]|nr:hypothetical protein [Lachnospiraceae bacterium]